MTTEKPLLDWDQFARLGADIARWGAAYHRTIAERPVRAPLEPGRVAAAFPAAPPEEGAGLDDLLADLDAKVVFKRACALAEAKGDVDPEERKLLRSPAAGAPPLMPDA